MTRPVGLARAFNGDIIAFGAKLNRDVLSGLKYEAIGSGSNLVELIPRMVHSKTSGVEFSDRRRHCIQHLHIVRVIWSTDKRRAHVPEFVQCCPRHRSPEVVTIALVELFGM